MLAESLKNEMKLKAIDLMKTLDIYKPYIMDYKTKNFITYFIRHIGFYLTDYDKLHSYLKQKINEIEINSNCIVYAVIESYSNKYNMHFYNYLIVPNYKEDWDYLVNESNIDLSNFNNKYKDLPNAKVFDVLAYVENTDAPEFSEMGVITVSSFFGGLDRVY